MKRLKTIAVYLPQFHRLPENDEWWGDGFTEWTAVKAADKLFVGHNQKREPLNDNYYDLLEKKTMVWQTELARSYGIYGFCFFHYYFENGKKILEKPAENLLKWKEIDTNFCFCWANETWARTWSGINAKNAWSEKFESKKGNDSGILLKQGYGSEKEWKAHFEYLLPFFMDERYIKIDNRPVFIFYKPDDILVLNSMLEYWNLLALNAGLSGIYSIATNSLKHKGTNAILLQGPGAYKDIKIIGEMVESERINQVTCVNYEKVWKNAVHSKVPKEYKVYYGGFVDFDDTPRRGKAGWLMRGTTPEIFEKYAYQLAVKNLVCGNEFYFINAWNEWGEGNYLEPDKKNQYAYLEALKRIVDRCNSPDFNLTEEWHTIIQNEYILYDNERENRLLKEVERYQKCYQLLNRWLLLKEKNFRLAEFFIKESYKKIVIYGFAAMGAHLYEELKDTSIEIVCAIDRRFGLKHWQLEVLSPEENIPECDVIVVTVIQGAELIVKELQLRTDKPVITLWSVIFGQTSG
ncbi:hypothetical protein D7V94_18980 [Parablautia intestinalis]|uniref:Glycosyl transferase n=1 Tax=Parablautia intestinalis TaxID=2320100 RepID=A0A3A9AAE9_9FIRM|nr:glycoside hydrolase family 99-like domain-containing protein [Parablautia intestinalis]RKI88680.1 hypothetical protein D7V94_18980 [Parablautia intestinalis]